MNDKEFDPLAELRQGKNKQRKAELKMCAFRQELLKSNAERIRKLGKKGAITVTILENQLFVSPKRHFLKSSSRHSPSQIHLSVSNDGRMSVDTISASILKKNSLDIENNDIVDDERIKEILSLSSMWEKQTLLWLLDRFIIVLFVPSAGGFSQRAQLFTCLILLICTFILWYTNNFISLSIGCVMLLIFAIFGVFASLNNKRMMSQNEG